MGSSPNARLGVSSWWLAAISISNSGEDMSPIRHMWMHSSPPDTRVTWIGSSVTPGWKTENLWVSNTFTTRLNWPLSTFRLCATPPSGESTQCRPPVHELLQKPEFVSAGHSLSQNIPVVEYALLSTTLRGSPRTRSIPANSTARLLTNCSNVDSKASAARLH